jgi:hypothetical protein
MTEPQVPPPMNGQRQRDRTQHPGAEPTILRALLALTGALAVLALPAIASAKHHRAKHHRAEPPVVASGTTLYGAQWQATVPSRDPGVIRFSVDSRKQFQRGWLARLSLPSSPASVFSTTLDTSVDPRPEVELAGVTSPDVAMLEVHMSDGSIFEIYPVPAAAAAQNRLSWLSQIRVYDAFFPAGSVMPQTITAMDASNNVLAERNSNNGSF